MPEEQPEKLGMQYFENYFEPNNEEREGAKRIFLCDLIDNSDGEEEQGSRFYMYSRVTQGRGGGGSG